MITSALISMCRREFMDEPTSVRVSKDGDGSVNLFNVGRFPVVEGSYAVMVGTSARTETTHYTFDLDNGDLRILATPPNGIAVKSDHKYAHWRDKHWLEAIGQSIDSLNGRGFFRQVVRNTALVRLSSGISVYAAPSACVDVYEFLVSSNGLSGGIYGKPFYNWEYQQDANKLVVGSVPSQGSYAAISYLRNMQSPGATSAVLDVNSDWIEMVKKNAGAQFYRSMAAKIAKEGNANIDEGHFSFTNLRTMANDLYTDFEKLAVRKKPTRPAKDFQFKT